MTPLETASQITQKYTEAFGWGNAKGDMSWIQELNADIAAAIEAVRPKEQPKPVHIQPRTVVTQPVSHKPVVVQQKKNGERRTSPR